jgi:beta-glucanase (GH16 family)
MMRTHLVVLMLCATAVCGVEPQAADGYQLVWSDEFDQDGAPSPVSWVPELGFVRNRELQWYQLDNATCKGGILTIEARKEQVPNPGYEAKSGDWRKQRKQSEFTSACITTQGKRQWMYGRFEMRARFPVAQGTWPAFWTLGIAGEWPDCGEVDILEAYKGNLLANLVWGSGKRWQGTWNTKKTALADFGEGWPLEFHVWRMDWSRERISLSVDGKELNAANLDDCTNPDGKNPFRQPHYLLLNLAIGGDAAGDPGATVFPQRFEIDWVRVYQKP